MSVKLSWRAGSHAVLAAAGPAAVPAAVVLAGCFSPEPVKTQGARILHLTIASRLVHGTVPLILVTPAGGGAHRPLLCLLR